MNYNMLKPAKEIVADLYRRECKTDSILIHGVGIIQEVCYKRETTDEEWRFIIKLNDGMLIKANCYTKMEQGIYMEKGDIIEFYGHGYKGWGRKAAIENIWVLQLKLSEEKRFFTDVFMWDIYIEMVHLYGYRYKRAVTNSHDCSRVIEILDTGKEEELLTEYAWTYGHLVKDKERIIVQLDKVM